MRPRVFVFVRRGLWRVSREDFPLTPDPSPPFRGRGEDFVSVGSECGGVRGDHRTDSVAHLRVFASSREESHCCSGGGLQDRAA